MVQQIDRAQVGPGVNCPVLGMSFEEHASEHEQARLATLATQEAVVRIEQGQEETIRRLGNIEHALGNGFSVAVNKGRAKFMGSVNLRGLKLTKHWRLLLVIGAVFLGGRLSGGVLETIGQIIGAASGG